MKYCILFLSTFLLVCCKTNNETPEEVSQKWTDLTRIYIIQSYVKSTPGSLNKIFEETIKAINIDRSKSSMFDSIETEVMFAQDTSFLYVKQRKNDGSLTFDGILINRAYYGTAEWFNEKGTWSLVGHYYNNVPCGNWTYYGENLEIDSIVNKGNEDLLLKLYTESLPSRHISYKPDDL